MVITRRASRKESNPIQFENQNIIITQGKHLKIQKPQVQSLEAFNLLSSPDGTVLEPFFE
ncbi:hypothetical protein EV199_3413 [Pseudobacter ginsenosidimutans]|uniref:Uncharacterized protein n=1 Tax=Pseudobacter ginsenosidimutans TaxID=661488 RepID=A0A4Q7MU89_9BACT|nr:hypothetical protein EV199_3413 [Pseudobacter ginsenosidimutans]